MDSFKNEVIGQMVYLEWLNAQLLQATHLCTNSVRETSQELSGTIRISVGGFGHLSLWSTFWYDIATQYCDGLRGAIIVYDPEDPYEDL